MQPVNLVVLWRHDILAYLQVATYFSALDSLRIIFLKQIIAFYFLFIKRITITELGEKIYFTTKYTFPLYIQHYMYKTVNIIFMLQFIRQKTEYF